MKMLEHPNIVNLIEVINDPDTDHFYMVLEYVDGKWANGGSCPPGGMDENMTRKYLRDIGFCPTYHWRAADTWAVGVTLYCMVSGQYPFLGETLQETYDKIVNNPSILPDNINPDLSNLLEGLLCKDPEKRWTLDAVSRQVWVVGEEGSIPHYLCWCRPKSLERTELNGTNDAKDTDITSAD